MKPFVLLLLIFGVLLLGACSSEPAPAPTEVPPTEAPTQPPPTPVPTDATFDSPLNMANPASKFCVEQGYQLEIRDEAGGQVGYCLFPDGSECEEWAFYRGECEPGTTFASPIGMPNPASVFCEEQGYTLEIRDEAGGQVGYCLFPDGSECEEWAFYWGECVPGSQSGQ